MARVPGLVALALLAALVACCSCDSTVLFTFDPSSFALDQVGDWNPMGQYEDWQKYTLIPPGVPKEDIPKHFTVSSTPDSVTVTSNPFSLTQELTSNIGAPHDHVKGTFLTTKPMSANPDAGQHILRISSRMSARTYNTSQNPFPDNLVTKPFDDIRLGMGGLSAADQMTAMSPIFCLTNHGIYAMYHVDTFVRPYTCLSHSFFQLKRVADRKPDDFHNLAIEYDSIANTLSFFLEGKRVLKVSNLGFSSKAKGLVTMLDYGGVPLPINRFSPTVGFGVNNLLDGLDYHRPKKDMGLVKTRGNMVPGSILAPGAVDYFSSGNYCKTFIAEGDNLFPYAIPSKFWDMDSLPQNRLWGEGASVTVKSLVVETDSESLYDS